MSRHELSIGVKIVNSFFGYIISVKNNTKPHEREIQRNSIKKMEFGFFPEQVGADDLVEMIQKSSEQTEELSEDLKKFFDFFLQENRFLRSVLSKECKRNLLFRKQKLEAKGFSDCLEIAKMIDALLA
jgi:hypothetical protein